MGSHLVHNNSNILCFGFMLWEMSFKTFSCVHFHVNALHALLSSRKIRTFLSLLNAHCYWFCLWILYRFEQGFLLSFIYLNFLYIFFFIYIIITQEANALCDSRLLECQEGECRMLSYFRSFWGWSWIVSLPIHFGKR